MFGPGSRIATRQACDSVAGAFHPHVFGWMIHANVFASDEPGVIWSEPSGDSTAVLILKPKEEAHPKVIPPRSAASLLPAPVTAAPVAHPTGVAHPAPRPALDTALPSARHAAIIIVPGVGGDSLNGTAEGLAKLGYVTRVVRYLGVADGNRAIGDAITQLEKDPSVDSTRIALVGVSLGGRLAIWHAAGDP